MANSNSNAETSDSEQRPFTRSSGQKENNDKGGTLKKLALNTNKFMENFNPETSVRERRKLHRKLVTGTKKNVGAVYDEYGIHIATGLDLCDCLFTDCPGCYFPCLKCNSTKCGTECRVFRKYVCEQIDFEGCDITIKNSFFKK